MTEILFQLQKGNMVSYTLFGAGEYKIQTTYMIPYYCYDITYLELK